MWAVFSALCATLVCAHGDEMSLLQVHGDELSLPDVPRCPPILAIACEFGNVMENGCQTSECKEGPDDLVCPAIFDPVCGTDGTIHSSICEAGRAGMKVANLGCCKGMKEYEQTENSELCAKVVRKDQCHQKRWKSKCAHTCDLCDDPDVPRCPPIPAIACEFGNVMENDCPTAECKEGPDDLVCPAIFDPVCGTNGTIHSSVCEAGRAGMKVANLGCCKGMKEYEQTENSELCAKVVRKGKCNRKRWKRKCAHTCDLCDDLVCPEIFDPVCGEDGKIHSSACEAGRAGVKVVNKGMKKVEKEDAELCAKVVQKDKCHTRRAKKKCAHICSLCDA